MSFVFKRGNVFYLEFDDGKQKSTGIRVSEKNAEKRAEAVLKDIEQRRTATTSILGASSADGPLTVERYLPTWVKSREDKGVATWNDDESRIRVHVLPELGSRELGDVSTADVERLIGKLKLKPCQRDGTPLAPTMVRHIYTSLRAMYRDAVRAGLVDTNPCLNVDARHVLPPKIDKNPEWRLKAHFSRDEVIALVTDERIPWDRRAFYAVMLLAGLRFGEVSALAWRHLHNDVKPLSRLVVARSYNTRTKKVGLTKTQATRAHPVHPALAAFLDEWRTKGWPLFFGREPTDDDLIVPSRTGRNRSNNHMKNKFDEDLAKLGLRERRQHDARKTWLTQLVADGASKDILERITHARAKDVMSGYIELEWPTLCAEVLKWTLALAPGKPPPDPPTAPTDTIIVAASSAGTVAIEGGTDSGTDTKKEPPISRGFGWRSGRDSNALNPRRVTRKLVPSRARRMEPRRETALCRGSPWRSRCTTRPLAVTP